MATKRDVIEFYSKKVRELGKQLKEYEAALEQVARGTDAILYEVCMKYGSDKLHKLDIPVPNVENLKDTKIAVTKTDKGYRLLPVTIKITDEE